MTLRPCLSCGTPAPGTRCEEHTPQPWQHREASARARGYDTAFDKLSRRARRLQPFCSDAQLSPCSGPLTTDHLPSAWERKAARKRLRLADVDVVCAGHNEARGSSRPGSARAETHGRGPVQGSPGPTFQAQSQLQAGDSASDSLDLVGVVARVDALPLRRAIDEPISLAVEDGEDAVVVVDVEGGGFLPITSFTGLGDDGEVGHSGTMP